MTRISETEAGFQLLNKPTRRNPPLRTFEIDSQLPSLPLPPLQLTLDKYLRSTRPFLTDLEYLSTVKRVENFRNGVGKVLQFHLKARANREKNWLEKWWNDWAYLEWREPLLPYVSTAGIMIDSSETADAYDRLRRDDNIDVQAARAAILAFIYVKFFEELRNETLPVHQSRSSYFGMSQFRKFFNTCRIPQKNKDMIENYFKTVREGDCPSHFIVMFKNRFFKLDPYSTEKRSLSVSELYDQISWIIREYGSKPSALGLGALSGDRRDNWSKNREYLIQLSPKNFENLRLIEECLSVLNLDNIDCHTNDEIARMVFLSNPKNRFFDKPYQVVFSKNGKVGSNIEHSPFDGMVSSTVTSYFASGEKMIQIKASTFKPSDQEASTSSVIKPVELEFVCDALIETQIESCAKLHQTLCSQIEVKILEMVEFNKEKLKSFGVNPDTTVQMCLQLAYYQLHKKPAPTYETATTRAYYNGRTETVRSCTQEAVDWCRQMMAKNQANATIHRKEQRKRLELFKKACQQHDRLMNEARKNFGCDRHLLGLMLMSKELGLDCHEIFEDPAWKKSGGGGNFLISSSFVGFLDTVPVCSPFCIDGYSSIYSMSNTGVRFGLGRYRQSHETDLEKFSESLKSAFRQVEEMFANSKLSTAKL